jgi:hypothetical protein
MTMLLWRHWDDRPKDQIHEESGDDWDERADDEQEPDQGHIPAKPH